MNTSFQGSGVQHVKKSVEHAHKTLCLLRSRISNILQSIGNSLTKYLKKEYKTHVVTRLTFLPLYCIANSLGGGGLGFKCWLYTCAAKYTRILEYEFRNTCSLVILEHSVRPAGVLLLYNVMRCSQLMCWPLICSKYMYYYESNFNDIEHTHRGRLWLWPNEFPQQFLTVLMRCGTSEMKYMYRTSRL